MITNFLNLRGPCGRCTLLELLFTRIMSRKFALLCVENSENCTISKQNHLLNIRRSTRESQIKISFLTTKRPVALRNNLGKEN